MASTGEKFGLRVVGLMHPPMRVQQSEEIYGILQLMSMRLSRDEQVDDDDSSESFVPSRSVYDRLRSWLASLCGKDRQRVKTD